MESDLVRIRDTNHLPTFQDEELPEINMLASLQKNVKDVDLMAKLAKKGPRSKSTDPHPHSPVDAFYRQVPYVAEEEKEKPIIENHKRWSTIIRQTEMSQQEMMNSYRLLMNDHLRLERFLSIMTRDHEMARNRLESDLLDAMMCIEDLKQALEVKMARRRKVDPREAEERRYLIRQNKKLLNQLYDSAKKIESLELTKLEMKEQLDLLDFQIVEVENQRNQAEEELKQKIQITIDSAVQTVESTNEHFNNIEQLQSEVNSLKVELAEMHKNALQAKTKICNLQRENNDLKEQIVRIEDSENSLVESDKHLMAKASHHHQSAVKGHPTSSSRDGSTEEELIAQSDLITSLNRQIEDLKDALYVQKKKEYLRDEKETTPTSTGDKGVVVGNPAASSYVNIEDRLLKQVINTYQLMLDEKDEQLKSSHNLQRSSSINSSHSDIKSDISSLDGGANSRKDSTISLTDNQFNEVSVQTLQDEELTLIRDKYKETALFLTKSELDELLNELTNTRTADGGAVCASKDVSFPEILGYVRLLKTLNNCTEITEELYENGDTIVARKKMEYLQKKLEELILENIKLRRQTSKPLTESSYLTGFSDDVTNESAADCVGRKTAGYFGDQIDQLKKATNIESLKSFIVIAERRRIDLEKIIEDMAQSMNRLKNEVQMSTTELQASRRTEANLRRRLISAMESSGRSLSFDKPSSSNQRYSQIQSFYGASTSNGEDNFDYSSSPSSGNDLVSSNEMNDMNQLKIQNHQLENQIVCLNDKIKIDAGKLNDQSVRIANLEADNRSLIDRINTIQATEAATQKGIIKLQVLYEDMLREYSECQAKTWHEIEGSTRSSSKSRLSKTHGSHAEISKLKKKIEQLERQSMNKPPCESKVCGDVRSLLKAFQTRFIDTADRLTETQQKLDTLQVTLSQDAKNAALLSAINSNDFASNVIRKIQEFLSEMPIATDHERLDECQHLLQSLLIWSKEQEVLNKSNETRLQSKIIQLCNPSSATII